MDTWERTYCCIDLKSFYASVECADAGWDPFEKLLVVADESRGEKTICLAVSPALKALGVPGRCRVFELPKGLKIHKARPRMRRYMEVSGQILAVYLRYVSAADLHVYSIDECFIDLTPYLSLYKMDAKAFVNMLRDEVMEATGVTATAGIGPNLFLAKVALDVTAKHAQDGIGVLDREAFRQIIWPHRPITDIWQIGPGIAARLQKYGIRDLGGVAHADIDLLYKEFGVNAEYLIDHAWGLEPCTIAQIKAYEPESTSFGNGQVLPFDYSFEEGRMILREMVDEAVLDLVDKRVVTDRVHLHVGYRKDTGAPGTRSSISVSHQLSGFTNSFEKLLAEFDQLYCERVDQARPVRRLNISFGHLEPEEFATYDLFTDVEAQEEERARQDALIEIKKKFGKSAVMRGTSYKEKARGLERAEQVGGHHE
ncbi:DNA repair protein [Anaerotardibacter muris]|uniref:Y-family DNA polymerase n=1 Tax=Anaerotardibacter muris TaxID=2941505 RepID=UPI00203D8FB1|nr:DNA repair protein [Anaerotardibacter muris]